VSTTRDKPGTATTVLVNRPQPRKLVRGWRLGQRLLLALTALAVFASPFLVAFYFNYRAQWIGPQVDNVQARIPAAQAEQFKHDAAIALPHSEPIILAYHDIARGSVSHYVVTPGAFAAQLAMLRQAGYHSLTSAQLVRYLHGGSVPSRSVAITFDDGTRGLWTYADQILKRYHFHAISFVITSRVGTHRPYYLTWQEIQLMHASGRWDFGSHTNDLHQKVPVSASGRLGDPLTQQIWLRSRHRLETLAEFNARVRSDLNSSIRAFTSRELPRPWLFAYPFSDSLGTAPHIASTDANKLIHQLFAGAMTNYVTPPVPVSRREAATGIVSRLEVTSTDTALNLFDQLRTIASLPVADTAGFADRDRWLSEKSGLANVTVARRTVIFQGRQERWAYAAYAPGGSADWDDYQIMARITGLNPRTNPSATISVRLGSAAQLNVSIANHYVKVRPGSLRSTTIALARALPARRTHQVTIKVRGRLSVLSVDGQVLLRRRVTPGPTSTGGFALASFRSVRARPFPRIKVIALRPLAP
jgi:poly-beta-1,6-N-acetyl-D-glucosamine N-deacetylase